MKIGGIKRKSSQGLEDLFSEGGTTVDDKWADIGGIVGNILGDSGDFFDV